MTREEAIFYIKELQKTYASMDKKVAEAVDMAIEALQADAVSRYEYDRLYAEADYFAKRLRSAVEVVRCKNCKFWIDNSNCNRWTDDSHDQAYTNANDFCSYGERGEP